MKDWMSILNVKPSHFVNGKAKFDGIGKSELMEALRAGCSMSIINGTTMKSWTILTLYDNLMCFGTVNMLGVVEVEGLCGFPLEGDGDCCVRYLENVSDGASKKKITPSYIFIEW